MICRDKASFDREKAKRFLARRLKRNYYWSNREWPYKDIKPRILAEKYVVDESGYELKDYKFFCFDGVVRALFVATDRGVEGKETKFDFFDADFHHLPIKNGHENADKEVKCPPAFEEMKELAAKLSKGIPHVRVDFYDVNGAAYFGELTFSHWGGFCPFEPREWDDIFGSWLTLPE